MQQPEQEQYQQMEAPVEETPATQATAEEPVNPYAAAAHEQQHQQQE